jgi:hypothetical protein
MKEFRAAIAIRSSPDRIWSILTDGEAYPSWNTTVDRVEGPIAPGQTIKMFVKLSPGRAFPVRVVEFVPPWRMLWRGGAPLAFMFKGERTFTLSSAADGEVQFEMREVFSGLLSPLITKSIPDMQPAFAEFAACLKRRAES